MKINIRRTRHSTRRFITRCCNYCYYHYSSKSTIDPDRLSRRKMKPRQIGRRAIGKLPGFGAQVARGWANISEFWLNYSGPSGGWRALAKFHRYNASSISIRDKALGCLCLYLKRDWKNQVFIWYSLSLPW